MVHFGRIFVTITTSVHCVTANVKSKQIEIFELSDLLSGRRLDDLATTLVTTGLLAVHSLDFASNSIALEKLCLCKQELWEQSQSANSNNKKKNKWTDDSNGGIQRHILHDGVTVRTTLATATMGTIPLPLSKNPHSICKEGQDELETLRDQVAMASYAFVKNWDRLLHHSTTTTTTTSSSQRGFSNHSTLLLRNLQGGAYSSIAAIVNASIHLEHFHIYTKKNTWTTDNVTTPSTALLDWHIDAGLFLAFAPAQSCHAKGKDLLFHIDHDNQDDPVDFPPNTVAIMLGAGAEHWLQTDLPFKATRHAVKQMNAGDERVWYGMMHLVPENTIIDTHPERTMKDMRQAMATGRHDMSMGCGTVAVPTSNYHPDTRTAHHHRRRLVMDHDARSCNNVTNFFCWMTCMDIPDKMHDGDSLYCLDPNMISEFGGGSDIQHATEPCFEGHAMNPACMGGWLPTVPGVDSQQVLVMGTNTMSKQDIGQGQQHEPFCHGGTSMYMDGFHWHDSSICIIYLFPTWVISSYGKWVFSILATGLFGIFLELVISKRRHYASNMTPGRKRLTLSAVLYGLQLTLGYLLMLVVMTYSGPLFVSVIFGLVGGHILFNAQDAVLGRSASLKSTIGRNVEDGIIVFGSSTEKCINTALIPDGLTPCCQNDLHMS